MFMIDDLANKWVDNNGNSLLDIGEDWGHWGFEKDSMWDFLSSNLLRKYPYLKVTFFLVVGKRAKIINTNKYIYTESILQDKEFVDFLRKIDENPNVEIAYHGLTHGNTGNTRFDFIEEWETYKDIDEAIEKINKGKEIYYEALGKYPEGGKYCGYKQNSFSDASINKTGFKWWCRHWDAAMEEELLNGKYNYELEMFSGVVDIPSTIDGSYFSLKNYKCFFSKKYFKSVMNKAVYRQTVEKLILERIKRNQIISIQEHTSPYRADERLQYPNLVSDIDNIKIILDYLKNFDLWYGTGTEIANYFLAQKDSEISDIDRMNFKVNCPENINGYELTIRIEEDFNKETIKVLSNGEEFKFIKDRGSYVGTIKVYNDGLYTIKEG